MDRLFLENDSKVAGLQNESAYIADTNNRYCQRNDWKICCLVNGSHGG